MGFLKIKKGTKIIICIIILFFLSVFVLNFNKNTQKIVNDEIIKIGAILDLTSSLASYGVEYRRGLEMAVNEINNKGGVDGKKLHLIIEDDGGKVSNSLSAANKLIDIDKVKFLFTSFSAQTEAIAPIIKQKDVINFAITVSKIGDGNKIFRDYWDMQDAGSAIGEAIIKEKVRNLGVLALNYSDTKFFLNGLTNEVGNIKTTIENFNFGDQDFKTQLLKLKNNKPDAILVYAFPGNEAINITKQIKLLGLDNLKLFAGATTYGFPFMYQQLNDTLLQMHVIDLWYSLDKNNTTSAEFIKKYKEIYKEDPIGDSAYTYDDIYAIAKVVKAAGPDLSTQNLVKELRKIKINGAAGILDFDSLGNSRRKAYLQTFTKDGWVKYQY